MRLSLESYSIPALMTLSETRVLLVFLASFKDNLSCVLSSLAKLRLKKCENDLSFSALLFEIALLFPPFTTLVKILE